MKTINDLTKEGKEDLSLALLLLKDFKCDGKFNIEITKQIFELAEILKVKKELDKLLVKIPPMKIEMRYK